MGQEISYNFHIHTCLSPCASDEMTPANVVGMAVISGLDAIAITDHNSCGNCEAAMHWGTIYGITVIPGMELCTAEEVHVLCYFSTLESAKAFEQEVREYRRNVKNRPEFFGHQYFYDEMDHRIGEEEELLITSTKISFQEVQPMVRNYGGVMVPAHVDRSSTSLISNLGFVPEGAGFGWVEFYKEENIACYRKRYPYFQNCQILLNSDAHSLEAISEGKRKITVLHNDSEEILRQLRQRL